MRSVEQLASAVRGVKAELDGTYARQTRQERAVSWRAAGWSSGLVLDAVGAGPLDAVRAAIGDGLPPAASRRLRRAVFALSLIDVHATLETPRDHGVKPHRSRAIKLQTSALRRP